MTNQSNIERVVMQRVHLIRALRVIISSGVLSMLISLLMLWGLGREVWVAHVLQNAPKDIFDLPRFYLSAFEHTRFAVQVLTLLIAASLLYVTREIARAFRVLSARESF